MRLLVVLTMALSVAACASKKEPPATMPAKQSRTIVLEIRVPPDPTAPAPMTPKSKLEPTLTVEANPGEPFAGSTKIGEEVFSASGSLFDLAGGRFRIQLRYSQVSPEGQQSTQSTLELVRGEETKLAGFVTSDATEDTIVVLLN
jgi:hypothetical protein